MTSALDAFGGKQFENDLYGNTCLGMLNLVGYLPIIGMAAGVILYDMASEKLKECPKEGRNFYHALKVRAVMQILCIGFVLILVDIVVALGRCLYDCRNRKPLTADRVKVVS